MVRPQATAILRRGPTRFLGDGLMAANSRSLTSTTGVSTAAHHAAARMVSLVHAIEGCSQALRTAVESIAVRQELNATQLLALWVCGEATTELAQSELAARIGVSAAQASALVEQLRRRNLLEARRAADDRRRQHWSITSAGRTVIEAVVGDFAMLGERTEPYVNSHPHRLDATLENIRDVVGQKATTSCLRVIGQDDRESGEALPTAEARR
jgi:DNA-binding MarR family transcriptional regulator